MFTNLETRHANCPSNYQAPNKWLLLGPNGISKEGTLSVLVRKIGGEGATAMFSASAALQQSSAEFGMRERVRRGGQGLWLAASLPPLPAEAA